MTKDIADLKKFRQAGAHFYDSKIRQIKDLSSKLNSFDPLGAVKKHHPNFITFKEYF